MPRLAGKGLGCSYQVYLEEHLLRSFPLFTVTLETANNTRCLGIVAKFVSHNSLKDYL